MTSAKSSLAQFEEAIQEILENAIFEGEVDGSTSCLGNRPRHMRRNLDEHPVGTDPKVIHEQK